jgi:hypothetical protein
MSERFFVMSKLPSIPANKVFNDVSGFEKSGAVVDKDYLRFWSVLLQADETAPRDRRRIMDRHDY